MTVWNINLPVLLALVWPSKDPFLVVVGWATVLLLLIKKRELTSLKWLRGPAIIFLYCSAASMIHAFYFQQWGEFGDLFRILPIAAAILYARRATLEELYTTSFWVGILTSASLPLIEAGYFSATFEMLHARDLDESYGRHSGLFLNVSTLGIFSIAWFLLTILVFRKYGVKWHMVLSTILSLTMLVASGGKSQVVALGSLIVVWAFWAMLIGKPMAALALVGLISTPVFLHVEGVIYVHQITKLSGALEYGLVAVSSVQGRIDIWLDFLTLWWTEPLWILVGAPKSVLDTVGNTYDSDFAWVLLRYGVLAVFAYVGFLGFVLFRGVSRRNPLLPLAAALILMGGSLGVMTAFQFSFLFWTVLFMTCFSATTRHDRKFGVVRNAAA